MKPIVSEKKKLRIAFPDFFPTAAPLTRQIFPIEKSTENNSIRVRPLVLKGGIHTTLPI
jgi:hypothetical protein